VRALELVRGDDRVAPPIDQKVQRAARFVVWVEQKDAMRGHV
jgi:hypothetical protein